MTLSEEQKLFVIGRLACYETPTMVRTAFKEEFGVELARGQIGFYNPDTVAGKRLSDKYAAHFRATRKTFIKSTGSIPVANKAVRLKLLNDATFAAVEKKNVVLMASLLEQAAKETGDAYTNKQVLTHKGQIDTNSLSDAELVRRLAGFGIKAKSTAAQINGLGNAA